MNIQDAQYRYIVEMNLDDYYDDSIPLDVFYQMMNYLDPYTKFSHYVSNSLATYDYRIWASQTYYNKETYKIESLPTLIEFREESSMSLFLLMFSGYFRRYIRYKMQS